MYLSGKVPPQKLFKICEGKSYANSEDFELWWDDVQKQCLFVTLSNSWNASLNSACCNSAISSSFESNLLDAIASPNTYPYQSVGKTVSESVNWKFQIGDSYRISELCELVSTALTFLLIMPIENCTTWCFGRQVTYCMLIWKSPKKLFFYAFPQITRLCCGHGTGRG